MTSYKKLLLIFLIPFVLAVSLAFLGDYFFPLRCYSFLKILVDLDCLYYSAPSLSESLYRLLVIGLFIIAVILPPLITWREYQKQKTERKSKSLIINGNN